MAPQQVGRYQVLDQLGQGAVGDVYRAYDPDLDRQVAIKVLSRSLSPEADNLRQRFRREVQIAAHLNHPHIVTVYDVGLEHEPPYVVMELLSGGTLEDLLRGQMLPWPAALQLIDPICQALAYAHEAGIVHRDIKPSNIMRAGDAAGTLKIADFGLALWKAAERLSITEGFVGTIAYMSPEQANGEAVDSRSDIFALGLILYEAIAGQNPLLGRTITETLANAISYRPIDLSPMAERVPRQVAELIGRALARNRAERFQTCDELHQALAAAIGGRPDGAPGRLEAAPSPRGEEAGAALAQLKIENPQGLPLPPNGERILREMFAAYARVTIKEELAGGFSGSRVYVVRPVRGDGRPELLAVVKMAPIRLVEQEWGAYQSYIRDQIPGVAEIRGEPILPSDSPWGGLRYPLAGSGAFEVESLVDYYRHAKADDLRFVLEERLFKQLGPMWRFNTAQTEFYLAGSYDHLLPVNLLLKPATAPASATVRVFRAGDISGSPPAPGEFLRLAGFIVTEVDPADRSITLDWPSSGTGPLASFRVRLRPVAEGGRYQVGHIADVLNCVVTSTRMGVLQAAVLELFGPHFDLEADTISLPGRWMLPNPLVRVPHILAATPSVRLATIHGDLNLENILVDPGTREARLIDFATARRDHVLHDLLRLETGVLTRLLPGTLAEAHLPPSVVGLLLAEVHRAIFAPKPIGQPDLPHPALEKSFAMLAAVRRMARTCLFDPDEPGEYYQGLTLYLLGTLKFRNLEAAAKQIAFWGAAACQDLLTSPPKRRPAAVEVETKAEQPATDEPDVFLPLPRARAKRRVEPSTWLPISLTLILALAIVGLVIWQKVTSNQPTATAGPAATAVVAVNPPATTTIPPATSTPRPAITRPPSSPTPRAMPNIGQTATAMVSTATPVDVSSQPLTAIILLDTSFSMNGAPIIHAISGLNLFLDRLDPGDKVIVYTFGGGVHELAPAGIVTDVREPLQQVLDGLFAEGETYLYDAICQAADRLVELRAEDEAVRREPLYGLILISDGRDGGVGSVTAEDEMLGCLAEAEERVNVAPIILAYGDEADEEILEKMAAATAGELVVTDWTDIESRLLNLVFQ